MYGQTILFKTLAILNLKKLTKIGSFTSKDLDESY